VSQHLGDVINRDFHTASQICKAVTSHVKRHPCFDTEIRRDGFEGTVDGRVARTNCLHHKNGSRQVEAVSKALDYDITDMHEPSMNLDSRIDRVDMLIEATELFIARLREQEVTGAIPTSVLQVK